RPVYRMNAMEHRIDGTFVADELSKRYLRQRILDQRVKPDDHRANAAVSVMHAGIEHTRVAAAMLIQHVFVEHLDDLAQTDIFRRTFEGIAALGSARRMHKAGLVQKPHQLP